MAGVLLIAEVSGEQLPATLAELVGEGTRVAQALGGGSPAVLLAGKNVQALASNLGSLGVERVLVADSQAPVPPSPEWLLAAAEQAVQKVQPDVVLLTHVGAGRDLASGLAYRLNSGLVTDWIAQANGGFYGNSANFLTQVSSGVHVAEIGDFNGDAIDDILWRSPDGSVSVSLGNSNGSFTASTDFTSQVGNSWHIEPHHDLF